MKSLLLSARHVKVVVTSRGGVERVLLDAPRDEQTFPLLSPDTPLSCAMRDGPYRHIAVYGDGELAWERNLRAYGAPGRVGRHDRPAGREVPFSVAFSALAHDDGVIHECWQNRLRAAY